MGSMRGQGDGLVKEPMTKAAAIRVAAFYTLWFLLFLVVGYGLTAWAGGSGSPASTPVPTHGCISHVSRWSSWTECVTPATVPAIPKWQVN